MKRDPDRLVLWMCLVLLVVAIIFLFAGTSWAHTGEEIEQWEKDWNERLSSVLEQYPVGLSLSKLEEIASLVEEKRDFESRHLCHYQQQCGTKSVHSNGPSRNVSTDMGTGVSRWAGLVSQFFGSGEVERALCLMSYESGGNPNARNPSGASGLFQIMPFWAESQGLSREALFDPETNVRIAKHILNVQGWTAWSPYNRGLCRG